MIADTTFVSDLLWERRRNEVGPASQFLARHRGAIIRISIITAGEVSVLFPSQTAAWEWLQNWQIYRLHPGVMDAAADIDRGMMTVGGRLGENDNWIAGFAKYYREPLISRDEAFDRVQCLRRVTY